MSGIQDAKGKFVPAWARYVEAIAAAGALAGYDVDGTYIGFAIYCSEDAIVEFTPLENANSVTETLLAGYHPLACKSVTTTNVAIKALFAFKPGDATG